MAHRISLKEAYDHLPSSVVKVLNSTPSGISTEVLVGVKEFLFDCETLGVVFDPVTLESVLVALVPQLLALNLMIEASVMPTEEDPEIIFCICRMCLKSSPV